MVVPSNYSEKISNLEYSSSLVENCAYNKAYDVIKRQKGIVVAADTVVVLEGIILGKPKDKKEAFLMLKNLSNKTHFVTTSICLMDSNKVLLDGEVTYVTFRKLSDCEIINYIEQKNPLDKAGSYGIQDENFDFAVQIKGELDNVIGFPIKLFNSMMDSFV